MIEFTGKGWAELLLCPTTSKPAVITLTLEMRQGCCSADVLSTIVERCRKYGHTNDRLLVAPQPNISDITTMRLLGQYQYLGDVVHDDVVMWAAIWLRRDDFADFLEETSPQRFVTGNLLKAAAKCYEGEMVLWLVEVRGDEIRTAEQLICVLARLTGGNQNSNFYDDAIQWRHSGGHLGLWLLLVLGLGTEIIVSDKVLEEAKRGQSNAMVDLLRRLRQEGTSIELQHFMELLDPPLAPSQRLLLRRIASAFPKYSCHSRLPDDFLIRAALHKEVELVALILEHWPDAFYITTELLQSVVSTADSLFLNERFRAKLENENECNVEPDTNLENYRHESRKRALELMELLLRMRRRDVETAVCEDVCAKAASCGNLEMVQLLCEKQHLVPMNNEWTEIAKLNDRPSRPLLQSLLELLGSFGKIPLLPADSWGVSALAAAVLKRDVETVRTLLASELVNVNRADRKGRTVIFLVVQPGLRQIDSYAGHTIDENRRIIIARMLITAGARLDVLSTVKGADWFCGRSAVKTS